MKNLFRVAICIVVFALTSPLFAQEEALLQEPIELKISHFGPPNWSQQTYVLEPWAKKIEELTEKKIKFKIFPNEILGKASKQYDLVIDGKIDIACSITEYTPGRFPLTSVMKLPFMGVQSGEQASLVLWRLYQEHLKDEYKDTKILWLWCHGPGHLHTVNKQVKKIEDLKGLRIRIIDPLLGEVLEKLGAIPIACSAPDMYTLLKEGKLDGAITPWEGAYVFKVLDLCKYHALINMYTMPFFATMNKERYESLPADVKRIIDENSGEAMSAIAGRASDHEDDNGRKLATKRGDFIYSLPKYELQRWKEITMPIGDEWIEKMQAKDLPGQEVLSFTVDLFLQLQE
jgi:TRAP-type transport system periplasmic protein